MTFQVSQKSQGKSNAFLKEAQVAGDVIVQKQQQGNNS